ncbi:hypothetical protein GJ496_011484 [Pomphorhynchus laevis]|nr:hypothetical protein GJ496_011484 [Pomphorhynchus laevis]
MQVPGKPLVALLDGRNCSVEMPILKNFAIFAFCDAQTANEIHHKVLNEAHAALLWNTMTLTRDDLLKFKALKLIVRIGSSTDNIDVEAAGELGIAVSNIPNCCIDEMADSTISLILNLYRGTTLMSNLVREGNAPVTPEQTAEYAGTLRRVRGDTLGIVGLGRIGSAVAIRAQAFGLKVVFYDPYSRVGIDRALGIHRVSSLPELLQVSDCVTLHCPFNIQTHRMINESTMQHFKRGALLVNTASGFLVDELALATAIKEGIIGGAALDVFENNALSGPAAVLRDLPNIICTPKTAWYSDKSARESREEAANEVKRGLLGRIPDSLQYCINRDFLTTAKMALERQLHGSLQSPPTIVTPGTTIAATAAANALVQQYYPHVVSNPQQPSHCPIPSNVMQQQHQQPQQSRKRSSPQRQNISTSSNTVMMQGNLRTTTSSNSTTSPPLQSSVTPVQSQAIPSLSTAAVPSSTNNGNVFNVMTAATGGTGCDVRHMQGTIQPTSTATPQQSTPDHQINCCGPANPPQ